MSDEQSEDEKDRQSTFAGVGIAMSAGSGVRLGPQSGP